MNSPASIPLLGSETWIDAGDQTDRFVVISVGSMEQHGPHLPLFTDTVVADYLSYRLADVRHDVVIGPTIPVGASGEHQGFPGTLSIGTEALTQVLQELVRSARGSFRGVIVISGHGGNHDAIAAVEETAEREGDVVLCFSPRIEGGDAHAGRTETSILLALLPALVHLDRATPGAREPLGDLIGAIREAGVAAVSENGVLGDPTGASEEEGLRVLESMFEQLDRTVRERFDK